MDLFQKEYYAKKAIETENKIDLVKSWEKIKETDDLISKIKEIKTRFKNKGLTISVFKARQLAEKEITVQEAVEIMKNSQINLKLKQLFKAKVKYQRLLNEVESEIKKRHGCTPSDVDLDNYLDTYHFNFDIEMTIEEIDKEMRQCIDSTERVDFNIDFE